MSSNQNNRINKPWWIVELQSETKEKKTEVKRAIKLEKGVELIGRGEGTKKPAHPFQGTFDNMMVGDTVFLPHEYDSSYIHSCFREKKTEQGWRIVTRKVTDDNITGTRVWRLS